MADGFDAAKELRAQGLDPKSWKQALEAIESRLSPADMQRFSRAHKNFVAYRSEATLARFYGTVFELGMQHEVNGYRFGRLAGILGDLWAEVPQGASILDVGAGGGYLAAALMRHRAPAAYVAYDPVSAVRDSLEARGTAVLSHPPPTGPDAPFDLILCVDSLGEVNSDDDGVLSRPGGVPPEALTDWMEERYGFAQKLDPWRPYLASSGRILVWEPFTDPEAFSAVARRLALRNWNAEVRSRVPERKYLEIRPG